jgi:hypothetical protein
MGAPDVGIHVAPPSAFAAPESPKLEPLLPPEVVPGPPELEPPDPLDPLDPLASPEPVEPELDPLPVPEPPSPEDAWTPASTAFVPSETAGDELLPQPSHPIDEAREAKRIARARGSSVIMIGPA